MINNRIFRLVGLFKHGWTSKLDTKINYSKLVSGQLLKFRATPHSQLQPYYTVLATFLFWTTFLNYKKKPTFAMSFKRKAEEEKKVDDATAVLLAKADQLYDELKFQELYDLLIGHKDEKNDEILWRLARSTYRLSKCAEYKDKRKDILTEGKGFVDQALEINETNYAAHKWAAILVIEVAECSGTKQKLIQSTVSKQHMIRANELNPKDGTVLYLLGVWCYTFADLSWTQRKLAALVFATPPTSSYYEAQTYFLKAEEVDPLGYSMNLVMLAKTYMKMDDKPRAIEYLKAAREHTQKTEDDKQAHREAIELLSKLGAQ